MFNSTEKQIGILVLLVVITVFNTAFVYFNFDNSSVPSLALEVPETSEEKLEENIEVGDPIETPPAPIVELPEPIENLEQSILLDVPFTSQAPYENWHKDIYQYGCEEASILMAMHWVLGDSSISAEEAEKEIALMAQFEQESTGSFYDTSAVDTAQLIRDYFDYHNVEVRSEIDIDDIKRELIRGNLVIVPVNGQIIQNPFYTSPPLAHMIVIIGYDSATKEFIVNDPGTKRGSHFRHPEAVIDAGLQDYPTGHDEPILEVQKVMIVVKPLAAEMVMNESSRTEEIF